MGYTNETTHYSIPLPLGSDKTTPMDYNTSAQEVDTVLFEAKTDSASALQKANQLQQDLSTTNDNVTSVTGRVTTLEGTVTTQGGAILQNTQDIADVRADALDMIEAKDEGTAQVASIAVTKGEYFRYNDVLYIATQNIAVGDTIVPNTNCRATNVGTELNQLNTSLIEDVSSKFVFGSVFTAMTCKAVIINNKVLVLHLDGYKSTGLPVSEGEHFCSVNASLLARIESGSHCANAWNDSENPHTININKDNTGLAYTERVSAFHYIQADLVFILAD